MTAVFKLSVGGIACSYSAADIILKFAFINYSAVLVLRTRAGTNSVFPLAVIDLFAVFVANACAVEQLVSQLAFIYKLTVAVKALRSVRCTRSLFLYHTFCLRRGICF